MKYQGSFLFVNSMFIYSKIQWKNKRIAEHNNQVEDRKSNNSTLTLLLSVSHNNKNALSVPTYVTICSRIQYDIVPFSVPESATSAFYFCSDVLTKYNTRTHLLCVTWFLAVEKCLKTKIYHFHWYKKSFHIITNFWCDLSETSFLFTSDSSQMNRMIDTLWESALEFMLKIAKFQ